MTPTRGLPFAPAPGLGELLDGVGLGIQRRLGEMGRDLDEPLSQRDIDVPQSASSAGVHSTTRLCVAASGDSGAAGPDMSMTASCARGRKPAAMTAAPRSTWVVPRPAGMAGPSKPGNTPPPPGPFEQGWTASSTPTIRTESPGEATPSWTSANSGSRRRSSTLSSPTVSRPAS